MKKLISTIFVTAVVFAPIAAQAGQIQNRIDNQERRVYQGVRNGSITSKEYKRLEKMEDKNEAARLRAIKSGGRLTAAEAARLNRRLDKSSNAIYRAKHN